MVKKFCKNCQTEKNIEEFRPNRTKKNGYQHYCIVCDKTFQREWYLKNKEKVIRKAKISTKKNAEKIRFLLVQFLKDKSCVHCGEDNILVLEFDHIRDKEFLVSNVFNSEARILKEIDKCQILCANCHKIKTHREANTYKWRYSQEERQKSAKLLS